MEKDSRGLTYAQLEEACGGKPTAARLQQMAPRSPTSGRLREFPDPDSVRGLARGLRKTELTVVLAAAESLDLDVKAQSKLTDLLPPESDALTDVQIAAVQQVVWSMLHPNGVAGHVPMAMGSRSAEVARLEAEAQQLREERDRLERQVQQEKRSDQIRRTG